MARIANGRWRELRSIIAAGPRGWKITRGKLPISQDESAIPSLEADDRKSVYLHIGLPKTATSHIQSTLQQNRSALLERGLHYLQAGQHPLFHDSGHHLLAISLMEGRWAEMQLHLDHADLISVWDKVREEIEASPAKSFFASSEWFAFDVHSPEQLQRVRDELSSYRVVIVLVLRDIVDYVNSVYAQRVRDGYAGSVDDYIGEAWYSLSWSLLAGRWADVFGSENVLAFGFDDLRATGIVPGILGRVLADEIDMIETTSRNHSLPQSATMLLREINATSIDDAEKIAFRDAVKAFFERHPSSFPAGKYVGDESTKALREYCVWPCLTAARRR